MEERRINLFKNILIILIIFIVIPARSSAQDSKVVIGKFRVRLKDGTFHEGTKGLLSSTEFSGHDFDETKISIPLGKIKSIQYQKGNHSQLGAMIGLGAGMLCGLKLYLDPQQNDISGIKKHNIRSVFILSIGGALTGSCIGSLYPKWKQYPLPDVSAGISQNGKVGVALTLKF
jgi:hypothetical protein